MPTMDDDMYETRIARFRLQLRGRIDLLRAGGDKPKRDTAIVYAAFEELLDMKKGDQWKFFLLDALQEVLWIKLR
jgi:hypothetical protein